ncbi:hypothetical protein AB1N83_013626, partial [Pleurotus pulmonarius]
YARHQYSGRVVVQRYIETALNLGLRQQKRESQYDNTGNDCSLDWKSTNLIQLAPPFCQPIRHATQEPSIPNRCSCTLPFVSTGPAYFNDAQAINRSLDVLRVINEPTAAALAYGIDLNSHRQSAVQFISTAPAYFNDPSLVERSARHQRADCSRTGLRGCGIDLSSPSTISEEELSISPSLRCESARLRSEVDQRQHLVRESIVDLAGHRMAIQRIHEPSYWYFAEPLFAELGVFTPIAFAVSCNRGKAVSHYLVSSISRSPNIYCIRDLANVYRQGHTRRRLTARPTDLYAS